MAFIVLQQAMLQYKKIRPFSNVLLFNKQELYMVACDSKICRVRVEYCVEEWW